MKKPRPTVRTGSGGIPTGPPHSCLRTSPRSHGCWGDGRSLWQSTQSPQDHTQAKSQGLGSRAQIWVSPGPREPGTPGTPRTPHLSPCFPRRLMEASPLHSPRGLDTPPKAPWLPRLSTGSPARHPHGTPLFLRLSGACVCSPCRPAPGPAPLSPAGDAPTLQRLCRDACIGGGEPSGLRGTPLCGLSILAPNLGRHQLPHRAVCRWSQGRPGWPRGDRLASAPARVSVSRWSKGRQPSPGSCCGIRSVEHGMLRGTAPARGRGACVRRAVWRGCVLWRESQRRPGAGGVSELCSGLRTGTGCWRHSGEKVPDTIKSFPSDAHLGAPGRLSP